MNVWFIFQLFIAQYHIWLANDTHGILVLLPGHPLLNFLLTTTVFVLIAQDVRDVTVHLQKIMVPAEKKTLWKAIFLCFVAYVLFSEDIFYELLASKDRFASFQLGQG